MNLINNLKLNRSSKKKNVQILIYLVLLLAVLTLMETTRSCRDTRLAPILQGNTKDTLDVAILYGPLSYYLYEDTLGGINYDLLRIFEKETDTPLKFWPIVNLQESYKKLENGTFNLLASVPADYSIKQRFLITPSIFLDRLVLVQLRDSIGKTKINSALDLAGDSVYISEGSPAVTRIKNLSSEIGEPIHIMSEKDYSDEYLTIKVALGDLPNAIVNEKTAKAMKVAYPMLSFENPVSFTQFQVWVMPREDSLVLNKITDWFETFKETPQYRDIINKY